MPFPRFEKLLTKNFVLRQFFRSEEVIIIYVKVPLWSFLDFQILIVLKNETFLGQNHKKSSEKKPEKIKFGNKIKSSNSQNRE